MGKFYSGDHFLTIFAAEMVRKPKDENYTKWEFYIKKMHLML